MTYRAALVLLEGRPLLLAAQVLEHHGHAGSLGGNCGVRWGIGIYVKRVLGERVTRIREPIVPLALKARVDTTRSAIRRKVNLNMVLIRWIRSDKC
jgi:hypothetical protein